MVVEASHVRVEQAPAVWQAHFAKVMTELGFHRCKTDSNLYCHKCTELYVLCYVDDFRFVELLNGQETSLSDSHA